MLEKWRHSILWTYRRVKQPLNLCNPKFACKPCGRGVVNFVLVMTWIPCFHFWYITLKWKTGTSANESNESCSNRGTQHIKDIGFKILLLMCKHSKMEYITFEFPTNITIHHHASLHHLPRLPTQFPLLILHQCPGHLRHPPRGQEDPDLASRPPD